MPENTPANASRSLSAVIGANARRVREQRNQRQEDVVYALRRRGQKWTRNTLVAVEQGARSLGIEEIPMLAYVLECDLTELLRGSGNETIQLGDVAVPLGMAQAKLTNIAEVPLLPPMLARTARSAASEEAVLKAARKLGLEPLQVSRIAFRLWGRSLSDHRDALVDEQVGADAASRTKQAARGHVTRRLLEEIKADAVERGILKESGEAQ